jgi:hypothetical protein
LLKPATITDHRPGAQLILIEVQEPGSAERIPWARVRHEAPIHAGSTALAHVDACCGNEEGATRRRRTGMETEGGRRLGRGGRLTEDRGPAL